MYENDAGRINLVLNKALNIAKYYLDKAEDVSIEIVAYGPGLNMLVQGESPAANRIKITRQNYDNTSSMGCGSPHQAISKK